MGLPARPRRRPAYSQNSSVWLGAAAVRYQCSSAFAVGRGGGWGWSGQAGDGDQQGGRVEGGDVVAGPVVEDPPLGECLFDQYRAKRRDEQLPVQGEQAVAEGQ